MKKFNALFALFMAILLISCGSDDDYVPVDTDDQSPTAPLELEVTTVSETSVSLAWQASTDNVAVTGYRVYIDGSEAATVTSTSYVAESLISGTQYSFYVTAFDAAGNESEASNTVQTEAALMFKNTLSEMGIFQGTLANLTPANDVQLYELNSKLFTDYATKQRLIRLPNGTSMTYNDTDLFPNFPDNTLMAKTFYYFLDETNPNSPKQIIETRVLIKVNGEWKVGNYLWNPAQTEATYTDDGSTLPITYIDANGYTKNINYEVPSNQNCITCHSNNNIMTPIGPKLRSMNFVPSYTNQNQLDYFTSTGILEGVNSSSISVLPDWTDDVNYDIFERGRAYIDINCAHCHQPGGNIPGDFNIDFRYETPFDDTYIYPNRGEIEMRIQSTVPTYMMPQLGRTVVHDEAVDMLLDYLEAIEN